MNIKKIISKFLLTIFVIVLTACGSESESDNNAQTNITPDADPVVLGGHEFAVTYTYDKLGRMTVAQYPEGKRVSYSYDNAGNLKAAMTESVEVSSGTGRAGTVNGGGGSIFQ